MARYFPIHLDPAEIRCVVVGGGAVAERRIRSLLECGARHIVVVSPAFTQKIEALGQTAQVDLVQESYTPATLKLGQLVFACTDSAEINATVAKEARSMGAFVNVASAGTEGDFVIPAVFRRGPLTISVSTGGSSPLLAEKIAAGLGERFDESFAGYVEILGAVRDQIKHECADAHARRAALTALLDCEEDIRRTVHEQGLDAARHAALEIARTALKRC